jgi:hypothetical protein
MKIFPWESSELVQLPSSFWKVIKLQLELAKSSFEVHFAPAK